MKMIRDTVEAEQTTAFQFDVKGCEFLNLNFTGSDIYVSIRGRGGSGRHDAHRRGYVARAYLPDR